MLCLDAAESGKSLIKNRDILHFTYIPETILMHVVLPVEFEP